MADLIQPRGPAATTTTPPSDTLSPAFTEALSSESGATVTGSTGGTYQVGGTSGGAIEGSKESNPLVSTSDPFRQEVNSLETNISKLEGGVFETAPTAYDSTSLEKGLVDQNKALQDQRSVLERRRDEALASIEADFSSQKSKTETAQKNETGTASLGLARIGGYLGGSGSEMGVLTNLAQSHRNELSALDAKKVSALQAARNAYEDKDFELAQTMLQAARDTEKEIYSRKRDFDDYTLQLQQEKRAQAESEMKRFTFQKQLMDEAEAESNEGRILSLIGKGIDDPIDLINRLNYDDQGNRIGNASLAQVTGIMEAVQRATKNPETYEIKGGPKEGLYEITKDKNGRTTSIKTLMDPQVDELEQTKKQLEIQELQAKIANGGVDSTEVLKYVTDLRKEFNALPTTKEYNTVKQSYTNIHNAYEEARQKGRDNKSKAAADQALIIGFNKMLDPNSVVREGEFARSTEGQSLLNRLRGKADQAIQGGVALSDDDRRAIVEATERLYEGYLDIHEQNVFEYRGYAQDLGADPDKVAKSTRAQKEAPPLNQLLSNPKIYQRAQQLEQAGFDTDVIEQVIQEELGYKKVSSVSERGGGPTGEVFTKAVATKYPEGATGGQCGTFAHKVVDFPPVGDSKKAKIASVSKYGIPADKWKKDVRVGDVIITGENPTYGHVAVVNEVLPDGTVRLTESNFKQSNKVSHDRKIAINSPKIYGAIRGKLKVNINKNTA